MTKPLSNEMVVAREGGRFLITSIGDDPMRLAWVHDLDVEQKTRKQPLQVWFKWGNWAASDDAEYDMALAEVEVAARLNPYHEPAGSSKGGQFAKAPGGGGALAVAGMSATEAQAALGDVASWEGPRRKYAREACLTAARRRYCAGLAMRYGKELVGVAALDQSGDRLFVDFMATKRPGYGREMMKAICRRAAAQGQRVTLAATPASRGFYERIGMRARFGVDFFEFSAQAAAAYGQRLEPGEDEPEDGIFTMPIAQWPEDVKAEMLSGEAEGG